MNVRLFSGALPGQEKLAEIPGMLEKECLICYEGEFESMDGPVSVDAEKLQRVAETYNAKIARAKKLENGEPHPGFIAPVQLDHGNGALQTIGRINSFLELRPYKTSEGQEVIGLYGKLKFLGKDNVERVLDGRFANLSIGANFETGELTEVTVTPFPAAPEASLLSKNKDKKMASPGEEVAKEFKYRGVTVTIIKEEDGYCVYLDGIETASFRRLDEAVREAKIGVDQELDEKMSKGDKKMSKKMNDQADKGGMNMSEEQRKELAKMMYEDMKQLAEEEKKTKEEAETLANYKRIMDDKAKMAEGEEKKDEKMEAAEDEKAKMSEEKEEEKKELSAEEKKEEAKMADKEDEEKKEMSDKKEEEKKEMSEPKEEEKKEMASEEKEEEKLASEAEGDGKEVIQKVKESMSRLSKAFGEKSGQARLALKKNAIASKLSKLRSEAKITPAEIKKINLDQLAAKSDEVINATLATFESREPVVHTGVFGTTKAMDVSALSKDIKERQAKLSELEHKMNMPSKRKAAEEEYKKLQAEMGKGQEILLSAVKTEEVDALSDKFSQLLDAGKTDEAKALMKTAANDLKRLRLAGTGVFVDTKNDSLSESLVEMEKSFADLVELVKGIIK